MGFLEQLKPLWGTAKTVLPITLFMIGFKTFFLKHSPQNPKTFVGGIILSILGLHFFIKGVSMSLLPLSDSLGRELVVLDNKLAIVLFAFVLGYFATLVEPALRVLALEVEEISVGAIPNNILLHAVAFGFGLGMALGILKILNNIPIRTIIMPILIVLLVLIRLAPEEFVGIAMDCASATTGPVNIPINMALAIGLANVLEVTDPLLAGFGIVGLTSMGTIVSVLSLGMLSKLL
ncbi:MAG: DUF1538 domain-containing protein [Limnochordia bacterium]|nr:DUF1538 domain-containing protein [Bacillota bacterium]